jgi:hypothetical protein
VYTIRKLDGAYELWLRAASPAVKWGPRSAAMLFKTKGAARRALALLSARHRAGCEIVDIEDD